MSQAIAQTADRVYHSLSPMEQTQVRNIFVRLTRLDELDIKGHGDNIRSGDFSENGDYLLTASQDKTAKIWDKKGKLIYTLTGHREGVNSAYFSPDGQSVITASRDKTARVWPLLDQIYSGYKKWTSTV
ncbi:WD40 repeat domain-containing protein [Laspinema olomoucense]|uniref:WD40 repeat domain-containing protein n=1 Tax=Laspinema olomoucense TaxID=3231600 RepID=UPI00338E0941